MVQLRDRDKKAEVKRLNPYRVQGSCPSVNSGLVLSEAEGSARSSPRVIKGPDK